MDKGGNEINEVMVSVFCETFNHEPFIRQCLDGMLMQKTDFAFEVLIHDDASTDHTQMIIKEYAEKYPDIIKPILQHENQYSKGVGIWQTFQMPRARGKYIALCEGDDYWTDPLKLQKQVDFLETHEDYSMCFHAAEVRNEMDYPVWLQCGFIENKEYSATELFEKWIVPTASILYRKEIIKYPIKNENNILNGDIFIVEKCAHCGKVWGMGDKMSVYRIHLSGITYDPQMQKDRIWRYPEHYLELKRDFPLIDKKVVNRNIALSYFEKGLIEGNLLLKYRDFIIGSFYSPSTMANKIVRCLRRRARH